MRYRIWSLGAIILISLCSFTGINYITRPNTQIHTSEQKEDTTPAKKPNKLNSLPILSTAEQYGISQKKQLIEEYLSNIRKWKQFNGNILVAYKGHVVFQEALGSANPIQKDTLDKEAPFQLASVTKQFTALAIMMLQEQGKLAYDDTVTQYIPGLPYKEITIRNLLNHTAGLPDYMWLVEHKWKQKRAPYNHEIIWLLKKHQLPYNFPPGKRFDYSNTGYMLLASIIEKVSGQTYADFCKKHIFAPLGMEHTFVYSAAKTPELPKGAVRGFEKARSNRLRSIPVTTLDGSVGDKGIYSTASDLLKWDRALYNNFLVKENTLKEAFKPGSAKRQKEIPYGFGFRLKEQYGDQVVYHNGRWNGFRTSLIRNIDDQITIIILNNTNSDAKNWIAYKLEKIMYRDENYTEEDLAAFAQHHSVRVMNEMN